MGDGAHGLNSTPSLTTNSLTHIFRIFILKRDFVALESPSYEKYHLIPHRIRSPLIGCLRH